ncbi:hypothetical protein OROMI_027038 [Orobanche minor]
MNNFPIKCDHLRLSITVITKPTLHIFSLTSAEPKASSFQSIPPKFQFLLHSSLRFINQYNIIFRRIYVCLGALKKGFKAIGRRLLGLDGAFMSGPFPGQTKKEENKVC